MVLSRQHVVLLFGIGLIAKGVVKSLFGTNASLLLLLVVAVYYWHMTRQQRQLLQRIDHMRDQTASKLDALHKLNESTNDGDEEDDDTNDLSSCLPLRPTSFHLAQEDMTMITDRLHQHSRRLYGSRKERRKFLRSSRKKRVVGTVDDEQQGDAAAQQPMPPPQEIENNQTPSEALESLLEETMDLPASCSHG